MSLRTAVVALLFGAAAAALCAQHEGLVTPLKAGSVPAVADLRALGDAKRVALTFDDGPDGRYTPSVLDILERKAVRATFFVVGRQVRARPDLALQAHLSGHELENHTWSHRPLTGLDWAQTVRELARTQDELLRLAGLRTQYFRPPKGMYNADDIRAARAMGYRIVMWTVCLESKSAKTPQEMVTRAVSRLKGEAVILMHDGLLVRSRTVAALPLLIDELRRQGYQFVTVQDMLAKGSTAELVD